jgi:hypothetical protein
MKLRKLALWLMSLYGLSVVFAVLTGCESQSSLRNVDVMYTFDNVRKSDQVDDWAEIRAVLSQHANAIKPESRSVAQSAGTEIRQYRAVVNVPNLRAVDQIQRGLEELSTRSGSGRRPAFSLARLDAGYASNAITGGTQTTVSGFVTPGYSVLVYPFEGGEPTRVVASSGGKWTATLLAVPQSGWVYAEAVDPAGRIPTTYFRVNVSTQQQQIVGREEFEKLCVPAVARGAVESRQSTSATRSRPSGTTDERGRDSEGSDLRSRREREDAEWAQRRADGERAPVDRARDDDRGARTGDSEAVRSKRRELDERMRRVEEAQRRAAAGS